MDHKLKSRFQGEISITSDIYRWHQPYGRKQKGTKEPLEEGERGEWKRWQKCNIKKTKIMASGPITSWHTDGETMKAVKDFTYLGFKNHCSQWLQPWNQKTLALWKRNYDKPRQRIRKQRQYSADKGLSSRSYDFPRSHVWMCDLDHKEGWVLRNWCFWTAVLEKTLESPLDCKEIKPANPKGTQTWIFIGRTDAETLIVWPPDALTHWKRPQGLERLKAGEGCDRGWDLWMASPTQWTWVNKLHEMVKDREAWHAALHGVTKIQSWLSEWTTWNL